MSDEEEGLVNEDDEPYVEAQARRNTLGHDPAWVFELIPERLYCGPPPYKRLDAHYLTQQLGVTHIVNLMAATDATTKSGKPKDTWYSMHWSRFGEPPLIVRSWKMPALAAVKDPMPLFAACARDVVVPLLRQQHAVVYVHHHEGYEEEAAVALLAWAQYDAASFPRDLNAWLAEKNYERLLDDPLKRTALSGAVKASGSTGKGANAMDRFVTKRPRIKE